MTTYRVSHEERHDGLTKTFYTRIRAMGYADEGDTLTLLDESPSGEFIHVASFKNWNSIIDMDGITE